MLNNVKVCSAVLGPLTWPTSEMQACLPAGLLRSGFQALLPGNSAGCSGSPSNDGPTAAPPSQSGSPTVFSQA